MGKSAERTITLDKLWKEADFSPNNNQRDAIIHSSGPLHLPAGPGSGKTRVILWRTLNLIVFHNIPPDKIFLSTFTEKAAFQLREGLRSLLAIVTNLTGIPYDIGRMYVGTVHSLCQRLIIDRRFYKEGRATAVPALLDDLAQFFYVSRPQRWDPLVAASGLTEEALATLNQFFVDYPSTSRHLAATNCISLFNRMSEECLTPEQILKKADDDVLKAIAKMYGHYKTALATAQKPPLTDFSLLQQRALQTLNAYAGAEQVFAHVIIDEYQDTNTIQEKLFFKLAKGSNNITVVGDDDQALYRFRGATVENFVQFPTRCKRYLGVEPTTIPLNINYRSRKRIVKFYTDFMTHCDWKKKGSSKGSYRVTDKNITANSKDDGVSVIASTPDQPVAACTQIAQLVRQLIEKKKVGDPNQIAFLFPSFKYRGQVNQQVQRMKAALEKEGLLVYAPRAGRFLEVPEALSVFGVFIQLFGRPARGDFRGNDYKTYHDWLDHAEAVGGELLATDTYLNQYVADRRAEIGIAIDDYKRLMATATKHKWELDQVYDLATMKRPLHSTPDLSEHAKKTLGSAYFEKAVKRRIAENRPLKLSYVITRATSLDWSLLDLFYRICGFDHFRKMFDLAEQGTDEGPICNMALISQYLARYLDEYNPMLTAAHLVNEGPQRLFFMSFLFTLFRLGESEYEDAEDPFPKGRIPFLTIHQAKGLEFPIVVLGNPRKDNKGPQKAEELVRPFLDGENEPLDRIAEFDIMRMFYVALSRAKNLLVVAHYKGQGIRINEPFKRMLTDSFQRIPTFDLDKLPVANLNSDELPRNYSYTSDYLLYQKCPRQYMIFRQYGFAPSRSQTMFFGSLVHKTLDDLHHHLIRKRSAA